MANVLIEIGAKLAALGLGTVGTDIFLGELPASPYACGVVYEYGGIAPEKSFSTSTLRFETPAVQVVFRGLPGDYASPRAKAATAFAGLAAIEATTLSGTIYYEITPQQSPFMLTRDENECVLIATNYLCQKEISA